MKRIAICVAFVSMVSRLIQASENSCRIDFVDLHENYRFSLGVYFDNTDTVAGFQIPISFELSELVMICDSMSFTWGRCEHFEFLDSKIDNERHIVYISGVSNISAEANNEPLLPGQGEIARIYFTYEGDPGEAPLRIRQARYEMGGNRLEYRFWKPDGTQVRCRFEAPPVSIAE